jgi:predicted NBD/HSP70 family sugar kinase
VQAIRRRTGLEPEILGERAIAGDPQALEFWEHYGRDLGVGLASLIYVLTPEAIVIGGGISASAEFSCQLFRQRSSNESCPVPALGYNSSRQSWATGPAWWELLGWPGSSSIGNSVGIALDRQLREIELEGGVAPFKSQASAVALILS